ncbi:methylenetetrahydromethanopterin dehydrogenase, partial [Methylobacterium sp. BTF04]|uniref:methylene-tetrahydromethanopterin dehydrogenase N-terminal domain-containing protein n=1 Tax=Methylobacterium sp. BTF04 TaxID=2708300 RepID=UPI001400A898
MTRSILHMLTPLKHMSPFDVNMAVDAGFDVVTTYTDVAPDETTALVQDSIFSRAPQDGVRTAIFIAGKNAELALDMMDAARSAFVPPFENHVFADPAGAFTTGAAMIAEVRLALAKHYGTKLADQRIAIFGGGGVVAYVAAVLAAQEGACPVLVGHDGSEGV